MSEDDRYSSAIAAIDGANAQDPNVSVIAGETGPKELLAGRRVARWVAEIDPDANELQLLAARAHHFRRWTRPRAAYPEGRAGYLRWRAAAKRAHAEEVAGVLREAGYGQSEIDRVGSIIRKEHLRDPATQTHEDALCLVFLESQFDELTDQVGDEHMVEILRKTLPKMSERGIAAAGSIPLSDRGQRLVAEAVRPT